MIDLIPRLTNITNNCWLNSVTQAIISTFGIQNSVYSCTLGEESLAKLWWDFVKDIINNKNKGYETSCTTPYLGTLQGVEAISFLIHSMILLYF